MYFSLRKILVNSDIEYLAMMTDIEMEQEEDEQEVQDHGEEE